MNARGKIQHGRSLRAPLTGGLALFVLGSGFAAAQAFDDFDGAMPPRAVVWRLNDRGFTAVSRPRFDGRAYVVEADDPYGERVRVFVDAYDGAILRRQRVGLPLPPAPIPSPMGVARSAPGYGWTEEETAPRRPIREAERILPPTDRAIPALRRAPVDVAPSARPDAADRNPMGLNPDAKSRPEAPVKAARLPPAPRTSLPRASSTTAKLSETPPARPASEVPASAALEAPKPVTPATNATTSTPAAIPAKEAKDWKDPPAEGKKPVRVIGGATMVPGATETAKD